MNRYEVRCINGDCPFCVTVPGLIPSEADARSLRDAINAMHGGHEHRAYELTERWIDRPTTPPAAGGPAPASHDGRTSDEGAAS